MNKIIKPRPLFKILSFAWIVILPLQVYSQSPELEKESGKDNLMCLFDSEKDPNVACYRIPSILSTSNGSLIAAADERVLSCNDLRGNKDINIVIRRSQDMGKNWTDIVRIIDYPIGQSASDPSMIYDAKKDIVFLFYNFMDLNKKPGQYMFKVIQSKDHGNSWTTPVDITSQISKNGWENDFKFITSGKGIQTQSGKLLHTIVNLDHGLHVFGSENHGKSWFLIETPIFPGDESKIVELTDGSWMINSRINGGGYRYVHTSNDQGQSWESTADSTLIDPACNASFIRHELITLNKIEDLLLFCNPNSKTHRKNLVLKSSLDNGKTWQHQQTIFEGMAAYSSICILNNDRAGILFESDNYHKIFFTEVRFK